MPDEGASLLDGLRCPASPSGHARQFPRGAPFGTPGMGPIRDPTRPADVTGSLTPRGACPGPKRKFARALAGVTPVSLPDGLGPSRRQAGPWSNGRRGTGHGRESRRRRSGAGVLASRVLDRSRPGVGVALVGAGDRVDLFAVRQRLATGVEEAVTWSAPCARAGIADVDLATVADPAGSHPSRSSLPGPGGSMTIRALPPWARSRPAVYRGRIRVGESRGEEHGHESQGQEEGAPASDDAA
jgi:hypothetical protein